MEIERKWMVEDWPKDREAVRIYKMRQGYVCTDPTVRIREEAESGGKTDYVLCFKSHGSDDGLVRQEIEILVEEEKFRELEQLIGIPLIEKEQRVYALKEGLMLEVNDVDRGMPTHYMYAEIEYRTAGEAKTWDPEEDGLAEYLCDDVTSQPGQTMAAYWNLTRLNSGTVQE